MIETQNNTYGTEWLRSLAVDQLPKKNCWSTELHSITTLCMLQKEPTIAVQINGVKYFGQLTVDSDAGYARIDIRDRATGRLLVYAERTGPEGEQMVESVGPVPLAVMKWLIGWTRSFSYPPGAADWEDADAKVLKELAETRETLVGYRE